MLRFVLITSTRQVRLTPGAKVITIALADCFFSCSFVWISKNFNGGEH